MINILYKLISESLLSLYPIFVKKIPVKLDIQLLSRLLGYSLIPLFFMSYLYVKKNLFTPNVLLLAFITLIHFYLSF